MKPRYSFSSHRTRRTENIKKQRPKYPELAKAVIEDSDIVLEILDARFLEETRNKELEEEILKKGKKVIFILNKADLVDPKKIPKEQLKELLPYVFISCKEREGVRELRKKLQIESKRIVRKPLTAEQIKQGFDNRIKVGIIGYPNTGKSSLINVLVGKNAAGVGSDAGFTRGMQKVKLTSDIVLIDSPGVIPKDQYSQIKTDKITKNTKVGGRSYSQVRNPEDVVHLIMTDHPGILEEHYKLDTKGDVDELLDRLGRKKGILKRGGEPNTDLVARNVLKEWQTGKIRK
ncbi:GTPase Der [uncultured archaeon]|nr:GTPase Der [uncultured archaeon]